MSQTKEAKQEVASADTIVKMIKNVKAKDEGIKKGVNLANIAEEMTKRKAKNLRG